MRPAPIFKWLCAPSVSRTPEGKDKESRGRPDFGVAHEAIGETDCNPVGSKGTVRMFLRNRVHVGGRACLDGIALEAFLRSDTPTVVYTVDYKTPSGRAVNSCGRSHYIRQILFFT
jgi:hypothetical protein